MSVSFSPNSGCTVWLLSQLSHAPAEHEEMWMQTQFSASRTIADIWAKTCKTAHLNYIFLSEFAAAECGPWLHRLHWICKVLLCQTSKSGLFTQETQQNVMTKLLSENFDSCYWNNVIGESTLCKTVWGFNILLKFFSFLYTNFIQIVITLKSDISWDTFSE